MRARAALGLALITAAAGAASAQPFAPDPKNRVSFAVERTRDVANDWIIAVVGTSDEDSDAARLADRVNDTMDWALGVAKQAKGVTALFPLLNPGLWNSAVCAKLSFPDHGKRPACDAPHPLEGQLWIRLEISDGALDISAKRLVDARPVDGAAGAAARPSSPPFPAQDAPRYRTATFVARLAGADRAARFSATADRRRSLFFPVT